MIVDGCTLLGRTKLFRAVVEMEMMQPGAFWGSVLQLAADVVRYEGWLGWHTPVRKCMRRYARFVVLWSRPVVCALGPKLAWMMAS